MLRDCRDAIQQLRPLELADLPDLVELLLGLVSPDIRWAGHSTKSQISQIS
jgi:hypothetical protein